MATKRATIRQAVKVMDWYNEIDAQNAAMAGVSYSDTIIPLDWGDGRTLLYVADGMAIGIAHTWNFNHEQTTKIRVWIEPVNDSVLAVWQER